MTFTVVLRPQPGNDRTAGRLRDLGFAVRQLPLFTSLAVDWNAPDPAGFDALLLTSANAVRLAGPGLVQLAPLPVVAVGKGTATAARTAGLGVAIVGESDAASAVATARAAGFDRLLHLAGRERGRDMPGIVPITVYAAEEVAIAPNTTRRAENGVVLLHSPRAAARFALLADRDGVDRARVRLAGLSAAVTAAAGPGWAEARHTERPDDAVLCRLAVAMAQRRSSYPD